MSESDPPLVKEAQALASSEDFHRYLDARYARRSGLTHDVISAKAWLMDTCEISSLGYFGTSARAAKALSRIQHDVEMWQQNLALEV